MAGIKLYDNVDIGLLLKEVLELHNEIRAGVRKKTFSQFFPNNAAEIPQKVTCQLFFQESNISASFL